MEQSYTIKISSRSHSMRIAVHPNGEVVVSVPRFVPQMLVRRFIAKNKPWIDRHVARINLKTRLQVAQKDIPALKKQALLFVEKQCAHYAQVYGVSYSKITIRSQKSRWGSCSKSGNLSFNYKIAVLPQHIADYIVVHEICHLEQLNHSKQFWNLVAREVPNHLSIRKALRQISVVDQH